MVKMRDDTSQPKHFSHALAVPPSRQRAAFPATSRVEMMVKMREDIADYGESADILIYDFMPS